MFSSLKHPPIDAIYLLIPSSLITVYLKTSMAEDNNVSGALPVATPKAVFPAALATAIQLILFHSFFNVFSDLELSFSFF